MLYKIAATPTLPTDTDQHYTALTEGPFGAFYAYLASYYDSPEVFANLLRYDRNQVAQKKESLLESSRVFSPEITAELQRCIKTGDAVKTAQKIESAYIGAAAGVSFADVVQDAVILSIQGKGDYAFISRLVQELQSLAQNDFEQKIIQEQLCFTALYFQNYAAAYGFLKQDMDALIGDPVYRKKTEFDNQEFRMIRFLWVALAIRRPLDEICRYAETYAQYPANPNEVVHMANALFDVFTLENALLRQDENAIRESLARIGSKAEALATYLQRKEAELAEIYRREVRLTDSNVSFFFGDIEKRLEPWHDSLYELFHNNHSYVYQLRLFELLHETIGTLLVQQNDKITTDYLQRAFTNEQFIEVIGDLAKMIIARVRIISLKKFGDTLNAYARYVPEIVSGNTAATELAPENRSTIPWACLTYVHEQGGHAALFRFFATLPAPTHTERMQALQLFSAAQPEDIIIRLKLCRHWDMKNLVTKIRNELTATYPEYASVLLLQRYLQEEPLDLPALRTLQEFFTQRPRGWELLLPQDVDYAALEQQIAERRTVLAVDARLAATDKPTAVEALGQVFNESIADDADRLAAELDLRTNNDGLAQQETIFEVLAVENLREKATLEIDLRRLPCEQPIASLIHKLDLYFKNEKTLQAVFYCGSRTITAQLSLDTMALITTERCFDRAMQKEITDVLYRLLIAVVNQRILPDLNTSDRKLHAQNTERVYRSIDESPRKRRIMHAEYAAGQIKNIRIVDETPGRNPFDARYFKVVEQEGPQYALQPLYDVSDATAGAGLVRLGWSSHAFRVSGSYKANPARSENSVNRYVAFMLRSQNLPDDEAAVMQYLLDVLDGKIQDQSLYYDPVAAHFKFVKGCDFSSLKTGKDLPLLMDTVFVKGYVRVYPVEMKTGKTGTEEVITHAFSH